MIEGIRRPLLVPAAIGLLDDTGSVFCDQHRIAPLVWKSGLVRFSEAGCLLQDLRGVRPRAELSKADSKTQFRPLTGFEFEVLGLDPADQCFDQRRRGGTSRSGEEDADGQPRERADDRVRGAQLRDNVVDVFASEFRAGYAEDLADALEGGEKENDERALLWRASIALRKARGVSTAWRP